MGARAAFFVIFSLNLLLNTFAQVNNKICPVATKDINTMKGLPRFDQKGGLGVSGNWGDYPVYICKVNQTTGDKDCSFITFDEAMHNPQWQDYITSVLFYPGFAIFMCVFTFLCGICLGIGRYLCCCVQGGLCGKRYPTRKTKFCCCSQGILGYVPIRAADGQTDFGYPLKWRWANRGFMALFLFFILLWIGLGHFQGNEGLTSSMVSVADSPSALANTIIATVPIIAKLAENIVGTNLVGFIKDFNQTFNSVCDIDIVLNQIQCAIDKVNALPELSDIRQFVSDEINDITNTTDITAATNQAFSVLQFQKTEILNNVSNLHTIADSMSQNVTGVRASIDDTLNNSPTFADFLADQSTLFDDPTNGVTAVVNELETMDTNAPSDTDRNAASTSITTLLTTPVTALTIGATKTALQNVRNGYMNMPNLTTTATKMTALNNRISTFQGTNIIQDMVAKMDATQALLDAFIAADYPTQFQNEIDEIENGVHNISWSGLYNVVDMAEARVRSATNSTEFRRQIDAVLNLTDIIPCVNTLMDQIDNINDTLVTFPQEVQDVFDQLDDLNGTLNDFVAQANNFTDFLDQQIDQANSINFTDIRNQIQSMENETNAQADAINASSIINNLTLATQLCDIPAYDTLRAQLMQLNNAVGNSTIPGSVITATSDLGTRVNFIKSLIDTVISDLTDSLRGSCSNDPTLACGSDPDCGGNTCDIPAPAGNARCKQDQTTACATLDDAACGVDGPCLISNNSLTPLGAAIDESGPLVDQIRPQLTILQTLENSEISSTDTGEYVLELQAADLALSLVNSAEFTNTLDSLTSAFDIFDLTGAQNQFNDMLDNLNNLDLSQVLTQLDDLNGTFEQLDEQKDYLNRTQRLLDTTREALFVRGPVWLNDLSTATLKAIRGPKSTGITAEFLHVTDTVDEMITFWNDGQDLIDNITLNATDKTERIREILTALTDPLYTSHGPWHFFFALKDTIEEEHTVIYPGENEDQLADDKDGHRYPNGSYCWTSDCLKNTIEYYNNQPIGDLMKKANLNLPAILSIPMSRVELVSAPFLIPFFTAIFGMVAASLIFPGKYSDIFATVCSSCSACLMFCSMPWIFLFAGSFFILPLLGGDACLSVENVGYQYINGRGDDLCGDLPKANGTARDCFFDLTVDHTPFNFTLDILKLYSGVLGGCGSKDPFDSLYGNASQLATTYIPTKVDSEVADFNNNGTITVKQPVLDLLHNLGVGVGDSASIFVLDLQDTVGCSSLHTVYADTKNAFCCDVMTSIYWMISSWYLIGWSYLLCGCSAALLGRKRFPHELWGPDVGRDRQALAEDQDGGQEHHQQVGEEFEEGPHGGFHEAPADGVELDSLKAHPDGDRIHGPSMGAMDGGSGSFQSPSSELDTAGGGGGGFVDAEGGEHQQPQGDWRVS